MGESRPEKIVTACMIVIGNEILSGRTRDANLAWIAPRFNDLGIRLREARVIPDVRDVIVATINDVRARYDYVFTSGGIGPTHDDITADCIAAAFGVPIAVRADARALLETHYASGDLNEARLRMARIPEGATLIDNPVSKAPGFRIGNVFVMAGVPVIFQAMFESLKHELIGGDKLRSYIISAYLPEGRLAAAMRATEEKYAGRLDVGSYPFYRDGRPGTSIVIRSSDQALLAGAAEEILQAVKSEGAEPFQSEMQ